MERRSFLKKVIESLFLGDFGFLNKKNKEMENTFNFGWIPGYHSALPEFKIIAPHLHQFGVNKVACLWKPYEEVVKHSYDTHAQEGPDCVAHATGTCMDILTAIQVLKGKKGINKIKEKWITLSSTDAIYSGGRNLIAQNKGGAGMMGIWAVKYLSTYGNLLRIKYPPYDLTPYSQETMSHWDRQGLPESLLKEAKKHPLLHYTPVSSADEIRDAIAAGYPVVLCSYLGLNSTRDSEGFCRQQGSWSHAMAILGVDTEYKRPGFLIQNSWGPNWVSGPKRHGQPDGSAWVDYKIIDRQVKGMRDSYALCLFRGFPAPDRKYILW